MIKRIAEKEESEEDVRCGCELKALPLASFCMVFRDARLVTTLPTVVFCCAGLGPSVGTGGALRAVYSFIYSF